MGFDFDHLVIGSGFGGSAAALRLVESGSRVGVIEKGRRWTKEEYPDSNWNLPKFIWLPALGCRGIQALTLLRHAFVLHGVGVGGGSLVYANTLLQPEDSVLNNPTWNHLEDWPTALAPKYAKARRLLGAVKCPRTFPGDEALERAARRINPLVKSEPVEVGVFFGEADKTVPDPYFDGQGPDRTGCNYCGGCMTGCKIGAKNSLDQNYLYLAERSGARIFPERQVISLAPLNGSDGESGWRVATRRPGPGNTPPVALTAGGVILSCGVMGTLSLLFKMKNAGLLPGISPLLGGNFRTNSESLLGAAFSSNRRIDFSQGLAICASVKLDHQTSVEVVRYGKGNDAMSLISTELTDQTPGRPRPLSWLANLAHRPGRLIRRAAPAGWARSSIILLYMQTADNCLRLTDRGAAFSVGLASELEADKPAPVYFPQANRLARILAEMIDGQPQSTLPEAWFNLSTTAHAMGGCPMGTDPSNGVIDRHGNLFGYKNIKVVDGSMVPINLGVNPALTITALADYAMDDLT